MPYTLYFRVFSSLNVSSCFYAIVVFLRFAITHENTLCKSRFLRHLVLQSVLSASALKLQFFYPVLVLNCLLAYKGKVLFYLHVKHSIKGDYRQKLTTKYVVHCSDTGGDTVGG